MDITIEEVYDFMYKYRKGVGFCIMGICSKLFLGINLFRWAWLFPFFL